MKKDIYDYSNNTEINFDEYEKVELNDMDKARIKNMVKTKKQKKIWKKVVGTVVAASFALGLFFQTGTGKEVYVAAREFVLETFNFKQEEAFNRKDNLDQYVYKTDKMVYGNKYKIKIDSVMLHGNELNITSLIETDFKREESDSYYIQGLYLSGLKIGDKDIDITKRGGGGAPLVENPKAKYDLFEVKLTDDEVKLLQESKKITLLGEGLILKVNGVPKTYGDKFEIVLGDVKLNDIAKYNKKGDLNIKVKDEKNKINFTITGYDFNPLKQKIYAVSDSEIKEELYLEGTLDNGKKVSFNGHYNSQDNNIVFESDIYRFENQGGFQLYEDIFNAKTMNLKMKIMEEGYFKNDEEKEKLIDNLFEVYSEEDKKVLSKEYKIKELPKEERDIKIKEEMRKELDKEKGETIIRYEKIGKAFTIKIK